MSADVDDLIALFDDPEYDEGPELPEDERCDPDHLWSLWTGRGTWDGQRALPATPPSLAAQPGAHPMLDALLAAVPLEITAQRDWPAEVRAEFAHGHADALQQGADAAQFGGSAGEQRAGAAYFASLARVLAAMAYQPGGVTFSGRHWCTDHQACLDAEAQAAAGQLADEPRPRAASARARAVADVRTTGEVL